MTLVSVVLPTYNGQRYLRQSIESVLNQTHQDLELVIVNDCSTDDTKSIAEEFVKKDSRVKLISNELNSKLPKSLNIGFEQAQGEYYTWTSDDNYFHPTAIARMVEYLEKNSDVSLVCCDFEIVNEDDTPREIRNLNIYPAQMMLCNPCGACFLYRKSAANQVGEYNVNKFLVEDYDYWIRMGLVGKIGHIPELLYTYRFHPKSLTATRMKDILKSTSNEIREFLPLYLQKYPEIKNSKEIQEVEQKLLLEDVLENGDKKAFKILNKIYKPSKFYRILKNEYKNTGQKFLLKFISKLGILYKIKVMILKHKTKNNISGTKRFKLAFTWIKKYSVKNNGIAVDSTQAGTIYPEVSGYYIPTLIKWGDKKRAKAYADYLLSIQNADGSWNDPSGTTPYTFDTGQILKGLCEFTDEDDKYKQAFLKGCDWIVAQQRPDGSISTPDISYWGLPDGKFVPEAIHLYCLEPLRKAGKTFGIEKYEICIQKALDFYLAQKDVTAFETLSHFNAYVIEALIDLGETDRAQKAMDNIATYQREDGSVPAYAHVDFVCSTGLFQYAICWYKLGDVEKGNKAFDYALKLQNKTGGWYGSYGKGANYFPKAEIAWAVKYFLDALYYKTDFSPIKNFIEQNLGAVDEKRLVVIPSETLEEYENAGYDWLERYYNPKKYFDKVFLLNPHEKGMYNKYGMSVIQVTPESYKEALKLINPKVVRAYGGYWATSFAVNNKITGIPVISSVHDTNPNLLHKEIKDVDCAICVSNAVADLVASKGLDKSKIKLMPNRVNREIFSKKDDLYFLEKQYSKDYKYILCLGRLTPQKNIDNMLKALQVLPDEYKCIFIGREFDVDYHKMSQELGVADKCIWIASVKNADLARYYSFVDCMCTPSRWEGFGIVFIEAAACEAPIITSDIAPMNEYFTNGKNAILIKDYENHEQIAKAIKEICENKALSAKLGKNAREMSAIFDQKKVDDLEVAIYQDVIKGR